MNLSCASCISLLSKCSLKEVPAGNRSGQSWCHYIPTVCAHKGLLSMEQKHPFRYAVPEKDIPFSGTVTALMYRSYFRMIRSTFVKDTYENRAHCPTMACYSPKELRWNGDCAVQSHRGTSSTGARRDVVRAWRCQNIGKTYFVFSPLAH